MSTTDVTAPIDQRLGGTAGSSSSAGNTQEAVIAQLTASIADALALAVSNEHRCEQSENALAECRRKWDRQLADQTDACRVLADELAAIKNSHGYRVLTRIWQFRLRLAPRGSRRDRLVRAFWHVCDSVFRWPPRLPSAQTRQAAMQRVGSLLVPGGSLRERCLRKASQKVRRTRCRIVNQPGMDLAAGSPRNRGPQGDRHLSAVHRLELDAAAAAPTDGPVRRGRLPVAVLLAEGAIRSGSAGSSVWTSGCTCATRSTPLYDLPESDRADELDRPLGDDQAVPFAAGDLRLSGRSERVVEHGGVPDQRKLELHRKLATRSEIVLATARRLHDEMRRLRPDALYCPNGADYEHFHLTAPPPVPSDIADIVQSGRPIIGYYGALARWFDYELVGAGRAGPPRLRVRADRPEFRPDADAAAAWPDCRTSAGSARSSTRSCRRTCTTSRSPRFRSSSTTLRRPPLRSSCSSTWPAGSRS